LYKIGRMLSLVERNMEALPALAQARQLEPEYLPARYLIGVLLLRLREPKTAAEELAFVAERDPGHDYNRVQLRLGEALLGLREPHRAMACVERYEQGSGDTSQGLLLRARTENALGQGDAARQALRRVIETAHKLPRRSLEDQTALARARWWSWRGIGS
jgi:tetratricopeptide (TPR) repeat protein